MTTRTLLLVLLVACALPLLGGCRERGSVPSLVLDFGAHGEFRITRWRVCGPFKAAGGAQSGGEANPARAALEGEFLRGFGPGDAQIGAEDFTRVALGLLGGRGLPADFKNANAEAADGVVRFDQMFETKADAVAYAAVVVESPEETEAVLVSGADDAMKAWLNGEPLTLTGVAAPPRARAYGSLGRAADFTAVRLKKGANFLLVKVAQTGRMWGFNSGLLTPDAARARAITDESAPPDLFERTLLPRGSALRLDARLCATLRNLKSEAAVEVLDAARRVVATARVGDDCAWGGSLAGLSEGLYYGRLAGGLFAREEEEFYHGDSEAALASLQQRHGSRGVTDEKTKIDFETLFQRLAHLQDPSSKQPDDKLWQVKIVHLVHELEALPARAARAGGGGGCAPGTHLRGFRSALDGQTQHYMLHVPAACVGGGRVPLVVVVPYPLPNAQPFLKSVHVANVALIRAYVRQAERHGYAVLWPSARGNSDGAPVAVADIFEAMSAARSDGVFDEQRVYLLGWSLGGTYALLLGERYPARFAAVGAVMPPTDLVAFERAADRVRSPYPPGWLKLNSPTELAASLSNTPVHILHGDEDSTVPVAQSRAFVEHSQRLGFAPRLTVVRGMDHVYAPADPTPLLFEFFKGKSLDRRPRRVTHVTGQLKYGEAHWLRVTGMIRPAALARINATLGEGGVVEVETENVSSYELLLERMGLACGATLSVRTDGRESFAGRPDGATLAVNVPGVDVSSAGARPWPPRKSAELEGPLAHAFAAPFLVVEGTGGSAESRAGAQLIGRALRDAWAESYFSTCEYKKDSEVSREDVEGKNLILVGDADSNSLIRDVLPSTPVRIEAEYVEVGGRRFEGRNIGVAFVYPSPLGRGRYVVVVGGNGYEGFRLPDARLAVAGWYDFAVWDARDPRRPGSFTAGHWDAGWQRVETMQVAP